MTKVFLYDGKDHWDHVIAVTWPRSQWFLAHTLYSSSFSSQSHCPGGGCGLVLLPFITSAAGPSLLLLIQAPQQSQWFLTSRFDKPGGYMLIPFNLAFLPRAVTGRGGTGSNPGGQTIGLRLGGQSDNQVSTD